MSCDLYLLLAFLPFVDGPGAPEMAGYYPRDEERPGYAAVRDTQALNASYERFLRTGVYIILFPAYSYSKQHSQLTFFLIFSKFSPMALDLLVDLSGLPREPVLVATKLMIVRGWLLGV